MKIWIAIFSIIATLTVSIYPQTNVKPANKNRINRPFSPTMDLQHTRTNNVRPPLRAGRLPLHYISGVGGALGGFFGGALVAYMAGAQFPTKEGDAFPPEEQGKVDFERLNDGTKYTMLAGIAAGAAYGAHWYGSRGNENGSFPAALVGSTALTATVIFLSGGPDFSENGNLLSAFWVAPLGGLAGFYLTRRYDLPDLPGGKIDFSGKPPLKFSRIAGQFAAGSAGGFLGLTVSGTALIVAGLLSLSSDGDSGIFLSENAFAIALGGTTALGTAGGIYWAGSRGDQTGSFWWTFAGSVTGTVAAYGLFKIISEDSDSEDQAAIRSFAILPVPGMIAFNLTRRYKNNHIKKATYETNRDIRLTAGQCYLKQLPRTPLRGLFPVMDIFRVAF